MTGEIAYEAVAAAVGASQQGSCGVGKQERSLTTVSVPIHQPAVKDQVQDAGLLGTDF